MAILPHSHLLVSKRIDLAAHLNNIRATAVAPRNMRGVPAKNTQLLALTLSSLTHYTSDSNSHFAQLQHQLQPRKAIHKSYRTSTTAVIVRAIIFLQWVERICSFIKSIRANLFVQKFEDDVHRVASMVEKGADVVKEVAKDIDKVAEKVEEVAEKVEAIAEKVETTAERVDERVDEVFEILDGDKKTVISSHKVIEKKKQEIANGSTTEITRQEVTRTESTSSNEEKPFPDSASD